MSWEGSHISRRKAIVKWALGLALLALLIVVYIVFDPTGNVWFPKCPLRMLTGFECPGCGAQRAVHCLLRFDIPGALSHNVLLVLSIPYLVTGFVFDMRRSVGENAVRWRKRLFGTTAIWIIFAVIVAFWILRNIPFFGEYI